MVGSAIDLEAKAQDHEVMGKSSKELDLTNRADVFQEIISTKPDFLVVAAAKWEALERTQQCQLIFFRLIYKSKLT